ncbi:hypothetical protein EKO23_23330 [Nocardioides guangzhouensis]|uniref:Uncharacterized protein n=1 Tax=Nocardioides guangzhouensis TaxID=2497878 RepID=A0A4Q4Z3S4_9ACTN|nr:putative Ig domain-containing protein [Nocardioides guangzhouensis]RYP81616.1 hypothetical protein EKO23_23330 [Nocardioides guangzhouensis]
MSIAGQRPVRRLGALILLLAAVSLGAMALAPPAGAADITVACDGDTTGTTFTLTADCATTEPLTVPDGFTIDGAGFTISATDAGGPQWNGAIVTNAGSSMNIQNVTIMGPANGFQLCTNAGNVLYGIWFNGASGTVDNVIVDHIWQQQNNAFPSCQTGRAIRADSGGATRTVDITATTVRDYQKSGFEARAGVTMSVAAGSVAGPPHPLEGLIAQNGVTFVGVTSGRVENSTIHGSSDQAPGPPPCPLPPAPGACNPSNGTGVLLFGASGVTVTRNTFTGLGTDIGVAVSAGSTGNTISFNRVARNPSDNPDNTDATGIGIWVNSAAEVPSSATLICNTFDGWRSDRNIVGALQIDCTPLPAGTECERYSAHTPDVQGGPEAAGRATSPRPLLRPAEPVTWTLEAGDLPPGLELATGGAITGTLPRNSAGTYQFTVRATDATDLTATTELSIRVAPGCAPAPSPSSTAEPGTGPDNQPSSLVPTAVAAGDPGPARDATGSADDSGGWWWLTVAGAAALTALGLARRLRNHGN